MSIALLAVRFDQLANQVQQIQAVNAIIIDKLNRIEANQAHSRTDPSALNQAITDAIALLGVPLNAPQR